MEFEDGRQALGAEVEMTVAVGSGFELSDQVGVSSLQGKMEGYIKEPTCKRRIVCDHCAHSN